MRVFYLELKRIVKTRLTWILLLASLAMTLLMAWLPTTFVEVDGLKGLPAVRRLKELQEDTAGEVTPEKLKAALSAYQQCLKEYSAETANDLPDGVRTRHILPLTGVLHGVNEVYADPDTGIGPGLPNIDPAGLDDYYGDCRARLMSLMRMEQKDHPAARAEAMRLYEKVETPYHFYPGFNTDALDYQILLGFVLTLFAAVIAAPVFSSDYQTGADDIQRCMRHGRMALGAAKTGAVLLICGAQFSVCMVLFILITDSLFGWETVATSVQMLYSATMLADMTVLEIQWFTAGAGLLSLLATVSLTAFLSARIRTTVAALAAALFSCVLPVFVYFAAPASVGLWLRALIPSSGAAGVQTSILYTMLDYDFLNAGSLAIWLPEAMVIATVLELPAFAAAGVRSYIRHTL